jgi:hypothetical protein
MTASVPLSRSLTVAFSRSTRLPRRLLRTRRRARRTEPALLVQPGEPAPGQERAQAASESLLVVRVLCGNPVSLGFTHCQSPRRKPPWFCAGVAPSDSVSTLSADS